MKDTILFDLDGTLVPMEQDPFVHAYFKELAAKFIPMGFDRETLIPAILKGTEAMTVNDGSRLNRERFWEVFAGALGEGALAYEPDFDAFYACEFGRVKDQLGICCDRSKFISGLKERGFELILATNPLFPLVAIKNRLSWVGLSGDEFSYITHYDNSSYCKPNSKYFAEILEKTGKDPAQCVMVGNNPIEDGCARETGVGTFIITDYLVGEMTSDELALPHGTFADAERFLRDL